MSRVCISDLRPGMKIDVSYPGGALKGVVLTNYGASLSIEQEDGAVILTDMEGVRVTITDPDSIKTFKEAAEQRNREFAETLRRIEAAREKQTAAQ